VEYLIGNYSSSNVLQMSTSKNNKCVLFPNHTSKVDRSAFFEKETNPRSLVILLLSPWITNLSNGYSSLTRGIREDRFSFIKAHVVEFGKVPRILHLAVLVSNVKEYIKRKAST
jgi:hypothetical protein